MKSWNSGSLDRAATRGSGWHSCFICHKTSKFQCFCCPKAVCGRCICDSEFACGRGKKGFCNHCVQLAKLIEENVDVDIDGVWSTQIYCFLYTGFVASSNIFKFIFYSLIHQKSHQESAALVHKYTREEHLSQKKMQRDGILFQIYLSCLIFVIFIHSCWCFSCILAVYLGYIPLVLVQ